MPAPHRQASPPPARRFTLVELIAGLIVLAIAGAIFAPFLLGVLQQTNRAPQPVQDANRLLTVMERIAQDYEQDESLRGDLNLFRNRILQDPSPYGTGFTVVETGFVRFQNGQEVSGTANDNLKVVIANEGNILAAIFPKGDSE